MSPYEVIIVIILTLVAAAAFVPAGLTLLIGPFFIKWLQIQSFGQFIREDGPQHHKSKAGTPTGGGILMIGVVLLTWLGWVALTYFTKEKLVLPPTIVLIMAVAFSLGALGAWDDWQKIKKRQNKGASGYTKLAVQGSVGLLLGVAIKLWLGHDSVSFFHFGSVSLGWFYPLFTAWVITATSNSVNLTDGLDGLAAGTSFISFLALSVLLMVAPMPDIHGSLIELLLVCLFWMGALAGFWWFNRYPAKVFMGDTGSLAIGGVIAAVALIAGFDFWLVPIGIVFVLETLSVFLQVWSFKTTGKRIFKMSPLHHHFELCGWHEHRVVWTFYGIQLLGCMLAVWAFLTFLPPAP